MRRDWVIPLACLAALLAAPAGAPGQTIRGTVDTSAVSELRASWDTEGRLVSRSVTRRFMPLQIAARGGMDGYFLLSEVFDIRQFTPGEGVQGVVSASLRPLEPGRIGEPLWSVKAPGSEAAVLGSDGLYRVTDFGCCGAEDTDTYFGLLSGSELFRATGPILRIHVPGRPPGRRFVAFHDGNASVGWVERVRDSTVVGVLCYGDDRSPASRLLLTDARGTVYSGRVALLVDGSETREHTMRSRDPAGGGDASLVGGFSVVLEMQPFDSRGPVRIEIPVVGDALAPDEARLPAGIGIRKGSGAWEAAGGGSAPRHYARPLAGLGAGVTLTAVMMSLDEVVGSSCTGSGSYLRTCRLVFAGVVAAGGGLGALAGLAVRRDEPPGRTTRILVGSGLGAVGAFLASTLACRQEDSSNPELLCGRDGMVTTRATVGAAGAGALLGGVLGGGSASLQRIPVGVVARPDGRVGVEAAFTLRRPSPRP